MESILALQSLTSIADPLDDEMCWSTCSSSSCNSVPGLHRRRRSAGLLLIHPSDLTKACFLNERRALMESILALQSLTSIADPLDDEMCWSTCSSSNCNSSSVFIADADQQASC